LGDLETLTDAGTCTRWRHDWLRLLHGTCTCGAGRGGTLLRPEDPMGSLFRVVDGVDCSAVSTTV